MRTVFLFSALILSFVSPRELMIQRACSINPELSFCRPHTTTQKIRTESERKHDIFLRWAFVAAKDAEDIEHVDTEELERSSKKSLSVPDYCSKYKENFKAYCTSGSLEKLEGLLAQFCGSYARNCDVKVGNVGKVKDIMQSFPTPSPSLPSAEFPTPRPQLNSEDYCSQYRGKFETECEKEGFQPELFCGEYRKKCGKGEKLEKVDDETTKSVQEETDSLETPEEFEKHETQKVAKVEEDQEVEAQGSGTDEVTAYCTNYIENYNFYCVGDMAPEHAKFCNSYKKNCPDRVSLKQSGSFLGNEGGGESEVSESSDKTYLYKGSKREYCQKFSVNYEYYCKGTIENVEIFTKFCPSYKKACRADAPSNPFSSRVAKPAAPERSSGRGSIDFPDVDHPSAGSSSKRSRKKIKKRACTADCDERIFPHCTMECKCDYAYPAVQKFCNPPPLPLFLNTCRLWYYGCPKYERYHYASQFIYSKAEKGKVLEGPKTQTTFNLLSPSGEALPYKPARFKRDVPGESDEMVEWPEGSGSEDIEMVVQITNSSDVPIEFSNDIAEEDQSLLTSNKQNNPDRSPSISEAHQDRVVRSKNGTLIHLVAAPPLPERKNAKDEVLKDPPPDPFNSKVPELPRVKKTTGGEAVPVYSDSVFSNALAQYNSLTDSRGILHRPRSRSPFTKPGLWEPNPDDPHNRDHANKYYYRPESVAVDWLQGQIAYGAHWAVPAAGVGGTDGFSAVHFPSIGTFLNIPDDYD